ncbi:TPA: DUF924 family protein [Pseudomonas aeruginosa]|uniref:DUF924 family protein n=1 Tax=Pseudomonas aeruginosa TaxID=287 RepID=UPI00155EA8D6|nr:DUF924 family protein [Pseudomonas aeruginosa]NRC20680.1 DUF924 family protein [Pseudomonas aeruginosa]WCV13163.1 DUF924 family protein [Pseudomonas aeruginosa]HBO1707520.1 DUF924 family protein [Pseudomonas aeruginosa]HCF3490613.1 DUF924 family protein [Pseudomonas aeruginosa]HCF5570535.1 DUF924 family protein [Pseudomonas aeruginosa]
MSAPWETLLDWWFGTSSDAAEVVAQRNGLWFGKNVCQDADAGSRFGDLVNQALDGGLQEWTAEADGWLALILLLDQLPRMIYRDTPRAYAGDARAQRVVREGLEKGFDRQLPPVRRVFAYLVLEHAEDLPSQERAVACFRDLRDQVGGSVRKPFDDFYDYAERHHAVVARFGRFPHRNALLGRPSSEEETAFLREPGSRF